PSISFLTNCLRWEVLASHRSILLFSIRLISISMFSDPFAEETISMFFKYSLLLRAFSITLAETLLIRRPVLSSRRGSPRFASSACVAPAPNRYATFFGLGLDIGRPAIRQLPP